jgi:hypothetical protein
MLNLVQHLRNTRTYETLKQVQGDKSRVYTEPSYLTFFYLNPLFHSSIIPIFQVGIDDKPLSLFEPASDLQSPSDYPVVLVGISLFEVF